MRSGESLPHPLSAYFGFKQLTWPQRPQEQQQPLGSGDCQTQRCTLTSLPAFVLLGHLLATGGQASVTVMERVERGWFQQPLFLFSTFSPL